jgi:hypothetical protein
MGDIDRWIDLGKRLRDDTFKIAALLETLQEQNLPFLQRQIGQLQDQMVALRWLASILTLLACAIVGLLVYAILWG